MRTKALLLAAAFAAAGVATSMAQVYSVNAVGYVNVNLDPGFNMVSNPLDAGAGNNTVQKLFSNIQGTIPPALKVFIYNVTSGGFDSTQWDDADLKFIPEDKAASVIDPGNGVFVFNPLAAGTAPLKLTFVGEVKQGTLNNPLPKGFSIKANIVPQAGKPDSFGLPGAAGDKFFYFNKTKKGYDTYQFDDADLQWIGGATPGLPSIAVGEAWFHFRFGAAGTWTRTFNVNNPTT